MRIKNYLLFLSALVITAGSCKNKTKSDKVSGSKPDALAVNLDTTVSPGEDFFLYANGGWIKKNPIPAEQSSWGIGNLVIEENLKRLRAISEKAATANATKGSASKRSVTSGPWRWIAPK
jgi:Predicted metalloendopeptidase